MVLLAKRVKAKREPVKMHSTSSADENPQMRSKMSAAFFLVSMFQFCVSSDGSTSLIRRAHADVAKACRACAVSGADDLLRLSFAAVRSAPERPLIARTNRIHRIPELGRDAGIRGIL